MCTIYCISDNASIHSSNMNFSRDLGTQGCKAANGTREYSDKIMRDNKIDKTLCGVPVRNLKSIQN